MSGAYYIDYQEIPECYACTTTETHWSAYIGTPMVTKLGVHTVFTQYTSRGQNACTYSPRLPSSGHNILPLDCVLTTEQEKVRNHCLDILQGQI